jgi:quercetin dioxygenase-like cupin family protein
VGWQRVAEPGWEALHWTELLSRSRGSSKEFVVRRAEVTAGGRVPPHAHRQAEVIYVLSGRARGHDGEEIMPGSCVYHAPGSLRGWEVMADAPLRYLSTFACERLQEPVARTDATSAGPACVGVEECVAWRAVEPSKGLKIRVKRLLDRGVELMAGICEFDAGIHYTRHYHDQPEIYFILAGSAIVYKGDSEVRMDPGAALYLASREIHGLDSIGDEPLKLFWAYGCETAGHVINWTAVEPIYAEARSHDGGPRTGPPSPPRSSRPG